MFVSCIVGPKIRVGDFQSQVPGAGVGGEEAKAIGQSGGAGAQRGGLQPDTGLCVCVKVSVCVCLILYVGKDACVVIICVSGKV